MSDLAVQTLRNAPTSLAQLPDWIASLPEPAFRRAWPAAVIDATERMLTDAGVGPGFVGPLARTLNAVRARYDRRENPLLFTGRINNDMRCALCGNEGECACTEAM